MRQMLAALKCCHDHYMGHFDVKPEILSRSGDIHGSGSFHHAGEGACRRVHSARGFCFLLQW